MPTGNPFYMPNMLQNTGRGLLGYNPADMRRQMISRGLLGAGINMLANSGPSQYPTSFGQQIGNAFQGYQQGSDQARDDYWTQTQRESTLADYTKKLARERDRDIKIKSWIGGQPHERQQELSALYAQDPDLFGQEWIKSKFNKTDDSGKSQEERYLATLRSSNPNSAEYRDAYYQLYKTPKFVQTEYGMQPIMPAIPPGVAAPSYGGGAQTSARDPNAPDTSQPTAGGIVPGTERTPEKLKMAEVGAAKTLRAIDKYEALLDQYGEGPMLRITNPQAAALLKTAYSDLMIEGKELNNLGVLAGPDMGIMENEMTPPTGLGAAIPNLQTLKAQIAHIRDKVTGNLNEMRNQYVPPGPGAKRGGPSSGKAAAPRTQAEFDALPSGTLYQDPDDQPGVLRRKP